MGHLHKMIILVVQDAADHVASNSEASDGGASVLPQLKHCKQHKCYFFDYDFKRRYVSI